MPTPQDVMKMVTDNEVKFVDFRFTDTRGKEQHVSVPISHFDEDKFESGHAFDGSSIAGWKGIEDVINQQILEICKETGADSIKTKHGTAIRTVKSRYWTNDWERFYDFMFEHNVPELLERRIHQTNIKQFLGENPDLLPAGLNVDSAYTITVRRSK